MPTTPIYSRLNTINLSLDQFLGAPWKGVTRTKPNPVILELLVSPMQGDLFAPHRQGKQAARALSQAQARRRALQDQNYMAAFKLSATPAWYTLRASYAVAHAGTSRLDATLNRWLPRSAKMYFYTFAPTIRWTGASIVWMLQWPIQSVQGTLVAVHVTAQLTRAIIGWALYWPLTVLDWIDRQVLIPLSVIGLFALSTCLVTPLSQLFELFLGESYRQFVHVVCQFTHETRLWLGRSRGYTYVSALYYRCIYTMEHVQVQPFGAIGLFLRHHLTVRRGVQALLPMGFLGAIGYQGVLKPALSHAPGLEEAARLAHPMPVSSILQLYYLEDAGVTLLLEQEPVREGSGALTLTTERSKRAFEGGQYVWKGTPMYQVMVHPNELVRDAITGHMDTTFALMHDETRSPVMDANGRPLPYALELPATIRLGAYAFTGDEEDQIPLPPEPMLRPGEEEKDAETKAAEKAAAVADIRAAFIPTARYTTLRDKEAMLVDDYATTARVQQLRTRPLHTVRNTTPLRSTIHSFKDKTTWKQAKVRKEQKAEAQRQKTLVRLRLPPMETPAINNTTWLDTFNNVYKLSSRKYVVPDGKFYQWREKMPKEAMQTDLRLALTPFGIAPAQDHAKPSSLQSFSKEEVKLAPYAFRDSSKMRLSLGLMVNDDTAWTYEYLESHFISGFDVHPPGMKRAMASGTVRIRKADDEDGETYEREEDGSEEDDEDDEKYASDRYADGDDDKYRPLKEDANVDTRGNKDDYIYRRSNADINAHGNVHIHNEDLYDEYIDEADICIDDMGNYTDEEKANLARIAKILKERIKEMRIIEDALGTDLGTLFKEAKTIFVNDKKQNLFINFEEVLGDVGEVNRLFTAITTLLDKNKQLYDSQEALCDTNEKLVLKTIAKAEAALAKAGALLPNAQVGWVVDTDATSMILMKAKGKLDALQKYKKSVEHSKRTDNRTRAVLERAKAEAAKARTSNPWVLPRVPFEIIDHFKMNALERQYKIQRREAYIGAKKDLAAHARHHLTYMTYFEKRTKASIDLQEAHTAYIGAKENRVHYSRAEYALFPDTIVEGKDAITQDAIAAELATRCEKTKKFFSEKEQRCLKALIAAHEAYTHATREEPLFFAKDKDLAKVLADANAVSKPFVLNPDDAADAMYKPSVRNADDAAGDAKKPLPCESFSLNSRKTETGDIIVVPDSPSVQTDEDLETGEGVETDTYDGWDDATSRRPKTSTHDMDKNEDGTQTGDAGTSEDGKIDAYDDSDDDAYGDSNDNAYDDQYDDPYDSWDDDSSHHMNKGAHDMDDGPTDPPPPPLPPTKIQLHLEGLKEQKNVMEQAKKEYEEANAHESDVDTSADTHISEALFTRDRAKIETLRKPFWSPGGTVFTNPAPYGFWHETGWLWCASGRDEYGLTIIQILLFYATMELCIWAECRSLDVTTIWRKKPQTVHRQIGHIGRLSEGAKVRHYVGNTMESVDIRELLGAFQAKRGVQLYGQPKWNEAWNRSILENIPLEHALWAKQTVNAMGQRIEKMRDPHTEEAKQILVAPRNVSEYMTLQPLLKHTSSPRNPRYPAFEKMTQLVHHYTRTKNGDGTAFAPPLLAARQQLVNRLGGQTTLMRGLRYEKRVQAEITHFPLLALIKPAAYRMNQLPKGMILLGKPGNGRTYFVRTLATESRLPLLLTESNRYLDQLLGLVRLRTLFQRARAHAPNILFIRDMDFMTRHRERYPMFTSVRATTHLLLAMDGYTRGAEVIPSEQDIFVIGSMESTLMMDAAVMRSGRFEWVLSFSYPPVKDRFRMLTVHSTHAHMRGAKDVDWHYFAAMTNGFSCLDIRTLLNTSVVYATRNRATKHTVNSVAFALGTVNQVHDLPDVTFIKPGTLSFFSTTDYKQRHEPARKHSPFFTQTGHIPMYKKVMHLFNAIVPSETEILATRWSLPEPSHECAVSLEPDRTLVPGLIPFFCEGLFLYTTQKMCSFPYPLVTFDTYCEPLFSDMKKRVEDVSVEHTLERTTSDHVFITSFDLWQRAHPKNWTPSALCNSKSITMRTTATTTWRSTRFSKQYATIAGLNELEAEILWGLPTLTTKIHNRLAFLTDKKKNEFASRDAAIFGTFETHSDLAFKCRKRSTARRVSQVSVEMLDVMQKHWRSPQPGSVPRPVGKPFPDPVLTVSMRLPPRPAGVSSLNVILKSFVRYFASAENESMGTCVLITITEYAVFPDTDIVPVPPDVDADVVADATHSKGWLLHTMLAPLCGVVDCVCRFLSLRTHSDESNDVDQ